jgi:aquaglyceroporin related protein
MAFSEGQQNGNGGVKGKYMYPIDTQVRSYQTTHVRERNPTTNNLPDTVQIPEKEAPNGTEEAGSRNEGLGNNLSFSLANSSAQNGNPNKNQNDTYLDDEYQDYNPQYGQGNDGPTWSLAQPLPHIVRPGMRHGALPEDRKENAEDLKRRGEEPSQKSAAQKQQVADTRVKQNKDTDQEGFFNTWTKIRHYLREPMAEWLGVSIVFNGYMGKWWHFHIAKRNLANDSLRQQ